jgi:hypothetical protein
MWINKSVYPQRNPQTLQGYQHQKTTETKQINHKNFQKADTKLKKVIHTKLTDNILSKRQIKSYQLIHTLFYDYLLYYIQSINC